VDRRLLLAEAKRRGIESDWWAERQLRRLEEERLLRVATRRIKDDAEISAVAIDSLAIRWLVSQPNLLQESPSARVARIDCPTKETALEERARIAAAGGTLPWYREILGGEALSSASVHFLTLARGGLASPEMEEVVFRRPPGTIQGPIPFGESWILVETLEIKPAQTRSEEDFAQQIRETYRSRQEAVLVEDWVKAKREEVGVTIHEDVVDRLSPGV
jgi:hypothetical protein